MMLSGGPRMNRVSIGLRFVAVSAVASAFVLMASHSAAFAATTMPPNAATISTPGNGDYAGFFIVVEPNGRAGAIDGAGRAANELSSDIVQTFFADLAGAGPLDKLLTGDCSNAKSDIPSTSVEVNAPIVIAWHGQHTAALACVTDPRAVKIVLDATAIQRAMYVQAYRKRVTVGYGTGLAYGSGYRGNGGYDSSRFYIPRFQNESFSFKNYSNDGGFYFTKFDSGVTRSNGPWGAAPTSSQVFTNLPYSSPFTGLPSGSIPFTSPYSSGPYSSLPAASPFGASPYSESPFNGSGPPIVTHP
jgi:hypothetical protein